MDDLLRAAFGKPRVSAGLEDLPSVLTRLRKADGGIDSVCLPPPNTSRFDEAGPVVLPSIPSRSLDRYQLLGEIAHGGMGTVYLARDLDLGRDLAIKVLRDEYVGDAPMTQRFVEESQIAGQLEHPGIIPVHELGLIGENKPYLAMKLIRGETLASLLRKRKDTPEERASFVAVFEEICRPIAYAHSRRVVHRDLKPANIMVGRMGEVQVADWGLAKVLSPRADSSPSPAEHGEREVQTCRSGTSAGASLSGSLIGTPAYMSPEQARGEVERIDERLDVFGLGAILCEILAGFPPYHGGSKAEQIRQASEGQLADGYRRLDACGADAPLVALAKCCLAVDRRDRPRDAGVVADAVRNYRESMDRRARDLEIRVAKSQTRRRWLSALSLVLCLAALGVWRLAVARHDRRELATLRAVQAISEARGRRSAAEAAAIDDVASWNAALQAALGVDLLLTSDVDNHMRSDARQLVTEVEMRFVQARMHARLRKLRDDHVETFSHRDVGEEYADAFSEYFGVNFETLARDEAVRRCRESPIAEELVLALDEWAVVRHTNGEDWHSLAAIAAATSTARWRPILHAELGRDDFDQVVTDVDPFLEEDVPNGIRSVLAFALWTAELPGWQRSRWAATEEERRRWGEYADKYSSAIEALLHRALEVEPDNYRINCQLEQFYRLAKNNDAEGIQFMRAAAALRPQDSRGWALLADAYRNAGNVRGTFEAHMHTLALHGNRQVDYSSIRATLTSSEGVPRDLVARITNAIEDLYPRESERVQAIHGALDVAWEKLDRLSSDKALRLTEDYVTHTRRREPEGLALLAKVQFARGMAAEAVRNLEEAQMLRGDVTWRGEELATYRASLHPACASFASLDAAWEAAAEPKETLPDAIAGERDSICADAYRAYWQGRTFEREGRFAESVDQFRTAQRGGLELRTDAATGVRSRGDGAAGRGGRCAIGSHRRSLVSPRPALATMGHDVVRGGPHAGTTAGEFPRKQPTHGPAQ